MTLFIDLGHLLKIDAKSIQCFQKHAKLIENPFSRLKVLLTLLTSVGTSQCFQKLAKLVENRFSRLKVLLTRVGTSQKTGTPGTERLIAFSRLAVKGLKQRIKMLT
jgi:hypothetical protein